MAERAKARIELVSSSPVRLPDDSAVRRRPRLAFRPRTAGFLDRFEQQVLYYDVFRHANGHDVLLVGPPPRNLWRHHRQARYGAANSEAIFAPEFFISQSVMITRLRDVPESLDTLAIRFTGIDLVAPIQANLSDRLAGSRMLFTMSKDNPPGWVAAWADYHARVHGVDTLVLFDNGSSVHRTQATIEALAGTAIRRGFVLDWPHIYGAIDTGVVMSPYWTHFLQIASISVALRRFGAEASGIINCDIDEMVFCGGETVFEALAATPRGLLAMTGRWIEAAGAQSPVPDHRAFTQRLSDSKARVCRPRKWALDPRRPWVANLGVHPYMHWIHKRPRGARSMRDDCLYFHFKGINTGWKVDRGAGNMPLHALEPDPDLRTAFGRWADTDTKGGE